MGCQASAPNGALAPRFTSKKAVQKVSAKQGQKSAKSGKPADDHFVDNSELERKVDEIISAGEPFIDDQF